MTHYKRVEPVEGTMPGAVTAYEKESGRNVDVPIEDLGDHGLYAEVPVDDPDEPIAEDYLAASDTWEAIPDAEYESAVEEHGAAQEEEAAEAAEEEEAEPAFEDADLDEVPYRTLQGYASEYDDVDGSQSREDLVADLKEKRAEAGEEEAEE